MTRVKLIFDDIFGISNCWYPINSCRDFTVDNITCDLMGRFGVGKVVLEMDGFKFLGDGMARLLFKDNDQINVRSVSKKRSLNNMLSSKRIKLVKEDMGHDGIVKNEEIVFGFVDSADEYCSESSIECEDELNTLVNHKTSLKQLENQDDTSFHLSVNATSAIKDLESSDTSSVSSNDMDMDMRVQIKDINSSNNGIEKIEDKQNDKEVLDKDIIQKGLDGDVEYLHSNRVQPVPSIEVKKDRLVYYEEGKIQDLTIVKKNGNCFYSNL